MEIHQLQSFISISRTKNLTRSAKEINISQSAISTQIKQLEEELAVKLFERSTRGMELTEHGRVLLSYAQETILAVEALKQQAALINGTISGTLTLGLNTDPQFLKISKLNKLLSTNLPDLNVIFMASQSTTSSEMLRQGMFDMGFFFGEEKDKDIETILLAKVPVCIVIPNQIQANVYSSSWEELASLPWIWTSCNCPFYVDLQNELDFREISPKKVVHAEDEYLIKELVLDNQGLALMRLDLAEDLEKAGKIKIWRKRIFEIPFNICWLSHKANNSAVNAVARIIQTLWKTRDIKIN